MISSFRGFESNKKKRNGGAKQRGVYGEVFYIIEISKKPTSQASKGGKGKSQVMQHNRRYEFRVLKLK